jgi:hypothetical protein
VWLIRRITDRHSEPPVDDQSLSLSRSCGVESFKLNEIIDLSTLPDDGEDDENNKVPATERQEAGVLVLRFLNLGDFPDL